MLRFFPAILLIAFVCAGAALAQPPENKLRLKLPSAPVEEEEAAPAANEGEIANTASYAIGAEMGGNFKKMGAPVNLEMLIRGLQDAFGGRKLAFSDEEMSNAIGEFEKTVSSKYQERVTVQNKAEGEKFLAENSKKAGVTTLPSGLQYKIIKKGAGKTPTAEDAVTAHYRGTLVDGTEFDSSIARGQPLRIPVNKVIKGWTEALQLMKEGDKWQIAIPAALAYGMNAPPQIGPNQTLIFEIELLKVEPVEEIQAK